MQRSLIGVMAICFATMAAGQTYKLSTYRPVSPKKDDLTVKQAFDKALVLLRALGKDVKGQVLQMRLQETQSYRTWEITPSEERRTHSSLSIDSKTGRLSSFHDEDIEMEHRLGRSKPRSVRLSNLQYEGKLRRFLELAGYRQKFTRAEFSPVDQYATVNASIYELYNGVPVRDNVIGVSLRASDGAFSFVGSEMAASQFAGTVKVKEADARRRAQAERSPQDKPKEFRLWYARLMKGWRTRVSEVARPYYIAKYKVWDEVWIDAETGRVARHYKATLKSADPS